VLWAPAPEQVATTCSESDLEERAAIAELVAAGVRVLAVTPPGQDPPACETASSAAGRLADATGGTAVELPASSVRRRQALTEVLDAAVVRIDASPVCETGLTAVAQPDRRTIASGATAAVRWQVRVEDEAAIGAVLSCVLVPRVDGYPDLGSLAALTVVVASGSPRGGEPQPAPAATRPAAPADASPGRGPRARR
jgi:hypothetical protein